MTDAALIDIHREWLGYVQPVGLVVAPAVLITHAAMPDRDIAPLQAALQDLVTEDDEHGATVDDLPRLLIELLDWKPGDIAGAAGGPDLPENLALVLPEFGETLRPSFAVPAPRSGEGEAAWQLLIKAEASGTDLDRDLPDDGHGWAASPHQRFERLLRETGVATGLLTNGQVIRLVHAPRGETAGHASFPVQVMTEVAGRPVLSAFAMLLHTDRMFGHPDRSLARLLADSRKYQATVSTQLARQVLAALHELLRGLDGADRRQGNTRIRDLAARAPETLYGGLLTALMRLVFVLYAEDREMFPADPVWEQNYSLRGLFARLRDDDGRFPDTMDERFGAWSQLVALWRLIHAGGAHGAGLRIAARRGRLFDPARFPFLEGRDRAEDPADPPPVPDGTVWRILHKLMVVEGERLSYRTLDVEQIGSVYETMMGFAVERAAGHAVAVRPSSGGGAAAIVDLDALLVVERARRGAWLADNADRKLTGKRLDALAAAGTREELLEALDSVRDREATPLPVTPGTPVLQPTAERRRSGSHYTPRSLTEPIVHTALAPILNRLGAQPTPAQLLELRVLDPAMGSGAFLVEACRQLAEALVAAWARHGGQPKLPPDEDALIHARRLVAQRCLYGLDRNPMAVDLAKLSLWLATLARDHEFTFLDHALRHGDALVGLTRDRIAALHWAPEAPEPFAALLVRDSLAKAEAERTRIRTAAEGAGEDALRPMLLRADAMLNDVRRVGDAVVAAFFAGEKVAERKAARTAISAVVQNGGTGWQQRLAKVRAGFPALDPPLHPFHWEIEFPEVFSRDNPGFDMIVGNPPFGGKNTVIAANPPGYLHWLQSLHEGAHGNADLCAHFYRRAFGLLRRDGTFGMLATKTIRQGDTRATGLRWIRKQGGTIYAARRRFKWQGEAAVVVSVVHVARGEAPGPALLDGKPVERISAFLVAGGSDDDPVRLTANGGKSFQGSIPLGMGFTFDDTEAQNAASSLAEMHRLIAKSSRNAERIFPFIGGEEVNDTPLHAYHRFIISFEDFPLNREYFDLMWRDATEAERAKMLKTGVVPSDYPGLVAADWKDLVDIVEKIVKPERLMQKNQGAKDHWWRFYRHSPELYSSIRGYNRVLVINCGATPHLAFTFLPSGMIFANTLAVFAISNFTLFAITQSRVHEIWARFFASSLEDRLRYTPSDCFETFPFPSTRQRSDAIERAGQAYFEHRAALMIAANEGMTKTYNRFNEPEEQRTDIVELRRLHREMDRAVLAAYGWDDLDPEPVFEREWEGDEDEKPGPWRLRWPEADRDEVLGRLLELNARRAAEEALAAAAGAVAAPRGKKRAARLKTRRKDVDAADMFDTAD